MYRSLLQYSVKLTVTVQCKDYYYNSAEQCTVDCMPGQFCDACRDAVSGHSSLKLSGSGFVPAQDQSVVQVHSGWMLQPHLKLRSGLHQATTTKLHTKSVLSTHHTEEDKFGWRSGERRRVGWSWGTPVGLSVCLADLKDF